MMVAGKEKRNGKRETIFQRTNEKAERQMITQIQAPQPSTNGAKNHASLITQSPFKRSLKYRNRNVSGILPCRCKYLPCIAG